MKRHTRRSVPTILLLASLLAACDSTNRIDSSLATRDEAADVTAPPIESKGEGSLPSVSPRVTSATAEMPGDDPLTRVSPADRVGPGVTDSEIAIGINLIAGGQAMGNVLGAALNFGDTRAQAMAVVNFLNSSGGIAGRRVKPVFYTFDIARVGLADGQSEQEACSAWTEDNKTFAVLNVALARQSLLACLAGRGVPGIHVGMPIDESTLAQFRDFWYSGFGGSGLTLDRLAEMQVKVFAARGFFQPGAVVGIQYFDDPAYRRVVDQTMVPLLKANGVQRIVLQGAPRGGSEATSYVVRFRREGVTNVLFLGEAAAYPMFFMRAADTQGYFPRYGLNTDQAPAANLQVAAPPRQLRNAIGMGWTPIVDVDQARDPGPVNENNALCLELMRKAGQDMSSRQPQITALSYCHGLFLLKAAMAAAPEVTYLGLSVGVAALGTSFASPGVFGTRFSTTQHDGVDAYRDFAFRDECTCFVYTSPPKRFP